MKAAIVNDFSQPPCAGEHPAPQAGDGEVLVNVRAAAISQLVRAQAAGRHYSSGTTLPMIPGADGVGTLADGQRVFFAFPKAPYGSMAGQTVVPAALCVPVPDEVDDITAAAIGNPGMSSVAALTYQAGLQRGETVLVNGAAGASGRLALQLARYMGAGRIIATARNPAVADELTALGADEVIVLHADSAALSATFAARIAAVDIVLDYLWGQPAACLLQAAASRKGPLAARPLRFVNIGSLAGADIALSAGVLRSNNIQLLGSGLGSVPVAGLMQSIGKVLQWVVPAQLQIAHQAVPLAQVTEAWRQDTGPRQVLTF